jgi:6-phosphogluconolactonase
MTLGVINRASVVLFLVPGASKARVVKAILGPKTKAERQFPASLVAREENCPIWFLDRTAAAGLSIHQQRTSI